MKKFLFVFIFIFPFLLFAQQLPQFKGIRYGNADIKGYYFLTANDNLILLDKDANVVYYYPVMKNNPVINSALFFCLTPGGQLFVTSKKYSCLMDSTFNIVKVFSCSNGVDTDNHDGIILPNGNRIMLGEEKVNVNSTNYPDLKRRGTPDSVKLSGGVIQEMDSLHNVVFEWHTKDHFAPTDADSFFINRDAIPEWTHNNAIEMDTDGNILLSSRNLNEITKINRKTGAIIWRLGGKKNEFKFINCPLPFYGQHDIRRLANGHITLFDNGQHDVTHAARALEFELDEVNKTATLKWSYTFNDSISSQGRGNVQRFKTGNTLVNFGVRSKGDACFVIVNPDGKKLFQVNTTVPNIYRVMHYSSLPFSLRRLVVSCFDSAGVKYLDAGAGYDSYQWNTGETSRVIAVNQTGEYSVFVPYGAGGFIGSEKIEIKDKALPCNLITPVNKNRKSINEKTKK